MPRLCRYWWKRPRIIASEVASVASSVHKCSRQVVASSASASVLVVGFMTPRLEGEGPPQICTQEFIDQTGSAQLLLGYLLSVQAQPPSALAQVVSVFQQQNSLDG